MGAKFIETTVAAFHGTSESWVVMKQPLTEDAHLKFTKRDLAVLEERLRRNG
jgi:hypothetical protein